MEINLKDTLRALRQKKNVTQEALANHLGITQQSVGKWERGEGFPDITLLPRIALYFDVTVDELLDVGKARIEERIQAYRDESVRYRQTGEKEKNLALWEKAYNEFPNDCRVMERLMSAIEQMGTVPFPKEDAERIISLGERILQESTDTQQREIAFSSLCIAYKKIGDKENALRCANMGGSASATRESLLANVQQGEEGVKACQQNVASLLQLAAADASIMLSKTAFSTEEKITVYHFSIDLLELLFPDGNAGAFAYNLSNYYAALSICYANLEDAEKTLDAMEQCAKYAISTVDPGGTQYTAPMVNRLRYTPAHLTKNYKGNACDLLLQKLLNPERSEFDFIRGDERFRQIVGQLKRHAEMPDGTDQGEPTMISYGFSIS